MPFDEEYPSVSRLVLTCPASRSVRVARRLLDDSAWLAALTTTRLSAGMPECLIARLSARQAVGWCLLARFPVRPSVRLPRLPCLPAGVPAGVRACLPAKLRCRFSDFQHFRGLPRPLECAARDTNCSRATRT